MNQKDFSLVQECTNKYSVNDLNETETETETEICIRIPKKFKTLWLIKLSDLTTTEEEIEYYKE